MQHSEQCIYQYSSDYLCLYCVVFVLKGVVYGEIQPAEGCVCLCVCVCVSSCVAEAWVCPCQLQEGHLQEGKGCSWLDTHFLVFIYCMPSGLCLTGAQLHSLKTCCRHVAHINSHAWLLLAARFSLRGTNCGRTTDTCGMYNSVRT